MTRRSHRATRPRPSACSASPGSPARSATSRPLPGYCALLAPLAHRHPPAFGALLCALDFQLAPAREVAIVGPDPDELLRTVRGAYRPHLVLAGGSGEVPLLDGREPVDGRAAAYVCERFVCRAPVTEPAELARAPIGPAGSARAPRE